MGQVDRRRVDTRRSIYRIDRYRGTAARSGCCCGCGCFAYDANGQERIRAPNSCREFSTIR